MLDDLAGSHSVPYSTHSEICLGSLRPTCCRLQRHTRSCVPADMARSLSASRARTGRRATPCVDARLGEGRRAVEGPAAVAEAYTRYSHAHVGGQFPRRACAWGGCREGFELDVHVGDMCLQTVRQTVAPAADTIVIFLKCFSGMAAERGWLLAREESFRDPLQDHARIIPRSATAILGLRRAPGRGAVRRRHKSDGRAPGRGRAI